MPKPASSGFKTKLDEFPQKWYVRFVIAVTCAGVSAMILSYIYPHSGLIGDGLIGGFTAYVDILLDRKVARARSKESKKLDPQPNPRQML